MVVHANVIMLTAEGCKQKRNCKSKFLQYQMCVPIWQVSQQTLWISQFSRLTKSPPNVRTTYPVKQRIMNDSNYHFCQNHLGVRTQFPQPTICTGLISQTTNGNLCIQRLPPCCCSEPPISSSWSELSCISFACDRRHANFPKSALLRFHAEGRLRTPKDHKNKLKKKGRTQGSGRRAELN